MLLLKVFENYINNSSRTVPTKLRYICCWYRLVCMHNSLSCKHSLYTGKLLAEVVEGEGGLAHCDEHHVDRGRQAQDRHQRED